MEENRQNVTDSPQLREEAARGESGPSTTHCEKVTPLERMLLGSWAVVTTGTQSFSPEVKPPQLPRVLTQAPFPFPAHRILKPVKENYDKSSFLPSLFEHESGIEVHINLNSKFIVSQSWVNIHCPTRRISREKSPGF